MADNNLRLEAQKREHLMGRWIAEHPEKAMLLQRDRNRALNEFHNWMKLEEDNTKFDKETLQKNKDLAGTQNLQNNQRIHSKIPTEEEKMVVQQRLAKSYEDALTVLQTRRDDDQRRFEKLGSTLDFRERKMQEQQVELEVLRTKLAYSEERLAAQQHVIESYREELDMLDAQQKMDEQRIQELSEILDLHENKLQDQQEELQVSRIKLASSQEGVRSLTNEQNDQAIYIKELLENFCTMETELHEKQKQTTHLERLLERQKVDIINLQAQHDEDIRNLMQQFQEQMNQEKGVQKRLSKQASNLQEYKDMSSTCQALLDEVRVDVQNSKEGADEKMELIEMIMARDEIIVERNETIMGKDRMMEVLRKDIEQQKTHRRILEQQLLSEVDEWKAQQDQDQKKLREQVEKQLSKQLNEWSLWHGNEDDEIKEKQAKVEPSNVDMLLKDQTNTPLLQRLQDEEEMRIAAEAKYDLLIKQVSYLQRSSKDKENIFELYNMLVENNTRSAENVDLADMNLQQDQESTTQQPDSHEQNSKKAQTVKEFKYFNSEEQQQSNQYESSGGSRNLQLTENSNCLNYDVTRQIEKDLSSIEKKNNLFYSLMNDNNAMSLQSINKHCEALQMELDRHRKVMKQMKMDVLNLELLNKGDHKNLISAKKIVHVEDFVKRGANNSAKIQSLGKQIKDLQATHNSSFHTYRKSMNSGALTFAQASMLYYSCGNNQVDIHQ